MNPIANQLASFLKNYLPFSILSDLEMLTVATHIKVIHLEKNQTLFRINDILHDSFYVVANGIINLSVISDAEETFLNKCTAGDVFGLRPFFAKNNYMMTAKAREESLVYAIPIATFRPFVAQNSEVLNFLLESFATNSTNPGDIQAKGKLLSDNVILGNQQADIQLFQSLVYTKKPVICTPDTLVKFAAQHMTDMVLDCVLVVQDKFPVGIVTDTDIRTKVATGRFSIDVPIDKIMSSPVITVPENVSLAEAQLLLLKHNVSHLCVTQDGSDKSAIRGVIREHDLILAQASNPGVLIKEIKRAQDVVSLKLVRSKLTELIQTSLIKNIPLSHIANISSEITTALLKRSVELAILDMGSPPARFAWISIGSQARKEQLLLTDADNILVFDDVAQEHFRDVKDYFIRLSKKTLSLLEFIGYPTCNNSHNSTNIVLAKSLTDWTKQYVNWIKNPGEKNNEINAIFFDLNFVYGEPKFEESLTATVFQNSFKNALFFDYLGNDAIRKPAALGFFKKYNLEETGLHKDKFDIKNRLQMGLIDGARLFILHHNIRGITNTYMRFKQLAMVDVKNAELFLNCAEAYLSVSKIRTSEGLKNDSSGQYVLIDELSKSDKEKLKLALQPLKDLEELIKDTFQLTKFS
ncbi:MAG: CBS domain-containing protein [Flavobacterium sp.]|nr:CBS domain-containing protein [Flavobacterium sp.]